MSASDEGPHAHFDRLRDRLDWNADERENAFQKLVERFSAEDLLATACRRLDRLAGNDADAILRIIEAHGSTEHFQALAEALGKQPHLPVERAWEAMAILDYVGMLDEYPALSDQWDEIAETLDETESIAQLVEQIEADDDGPYVALQGLNAVEPEVRSDIIRSLVEMEPGPGLVEFLRLLTFALEPTTRTAALETLVMLDQAIPTVARAWQSIAREHEDPEILALAREVLGESSTIRLAAVPSLVDSPTLTRCAVTSIDGEGRATIVLAAIDPAQRRWTGAAFLCDVMRGIKDVVGAVGHDVASADDLFAEFADPGQRAVVEGHEPVALALLASVLAITGSESTPALRFWVERTAGPAFRANAAGIHDLFGDWDPRHIPFVEMEERSEAIMEACPDWVDTSEHTQAIASEIALRSPGSEPDPRRDAGAYRFLFEHHLASRLELFQRMLYWMAAFWKATDDEQLGRSAQALAWQLADPQHAVPSHPFLQVLTSRSLLAAGSANPDT